MYKIIKSSNVGGHSDLVALGFFSSLHFPEVTMEVQTQTLVFSEESRHPPAPDEVQMCYLSHIPHLNPPTVRRMFSMVSDRDEGKERIWEEVELGGPNETPFDSSISSPKCK